MDHGVAFVARFAIRKADAKAIDPESVAHLLANGLHEAPDGALFLNVEFVELSYVTAGRDDYVAGGQGVAGRGGEGVVGEGPCIVIRKVAITAKRHPLTITWCVSGAPGFQGHAMWDFHVRFLANLP